MITSLTSKLFRKSMIFLLLWLDVKTRPGLPPPFRKFKYDTLKVEHKAHGAKV